MAVPSLGGALGLAPLHCGGLGRHIDCQDKPQLLDVFIGRILLASSSKMRPESSAKGLGRCMLGYHGSLDIWDTYRVPMKTEEKGIR